MSVEVVDRGLLAAVLELADDPDRPATGEGIAEALRIPPEFADFVERRLQRNRDRGFVKCDGEGYWRPTAAGIAAAISLPAQPYVLAGANDDDE